MLTTTATSSIQVSFSCLDLGCFIVVVFCVYFYFYGYHKQNLFLETQFQQPVNAETIFFETDFGRCIFLQSLLQVAYLSFLTDVKLK
jgi:hypothetical protein